MKGSKTGFGIRSAAVWLTVVLATGGCAFKRLKGDLKEIEAVRPVAGKIVNPSSSRKPVVVVLWSLDPEYRSNYWIVEHEGTFSFAPTGGRYYLLAFEDSNEDLKYETNEWAGAYGAPSAIDVNSGEDFGHLELRLQPPGKLKLPADVRDSTAGERAQRFDWREELTGEIVTLDDPRFSEENAKMGLWTPVRFLKKFGIDVYFLEPYDPNKIPVLFVHGAAGHPGNWKDVVASLDRTKYQPWVAYYPSGLRLDSSGTVLARFLEELRAKYGFERLVVVAHSMGGLVSRSMILHYAKNDPRAAMPLFVSISTPWGGHPGANLGVEHAPAIIPQWYDMVPGSPFLERLFAEPLPPETTFRMLVSYKGKDGTDGAVPLNSELFLPAQEAAAKVYAIDASHVGILSDTNALSLLNRFLSGVPEK